MNQNNSQLTYMQASILLAALFFLGFFATGCSKLVDIPSDLRTTSQFDFPDKPIDVDVKTDIPTDIKFGPDFAGAIAVCNDFYGAGTEEAAICFEDYRTYFNADVGINLDSILTYCEETYEGENAIEECVSDLASIINSIPNNEQVMDNPTLF